MLFPREVGKIWFTLEATLWTGQNDYTDVLKDINVSSVARRAAGVMLSRTGLYKEIINGAVGLVIKAGQPPQTVTIQNVLLPATFSPDDHQIVVDWVHKFVVREHGIYAGGDKVIKIVGGPPAVIDPLESGEGTQFLKSTEPFGIIQG